MRASILAYETDSKLLQLYREWLEIDYDMFYASSTEDTIALLSRYPQISILLSQGYSDSKELGTFFSKALSYNTDLYLIVATAAAPQATVHHQLQTFGAEAILYKPFSKAQLLFIIEKIVAEHPQHHTV